ncbi:MAG: cobaltochelatase subunit CobN [Pseudanabaenaceae cyanobacterium SKYGB_i_bin29]|nr:cobaltochelatase subunit CobN [Pseudanabaenaceae cyanobacterium SKYG29]MDW8420874.1 cobaltochelatase subunit CobN [Pseudanabaenaceae cyanobacterium SKYGB_i_bin29]
MHRLVTTPGKSESTTDSIIFVNQEPAPIIFITAADTDIQILAQVATNLPTDFPALRVVNILQLQQQIVIDTYADEVLRFAQVIILRIIGGRSYWSYGLEVVKATAETTGAQLIVLPGDDIPDLDLLSHSTVDAVTVNYIWQYFLEGGSQNYQNLLYYIANRCLGYAIDYHEPATIPRFGIYPTPHKTLTTDRKVALLFYRAHYLSGNTKTIDELVYALGEKQIQVIPIYVSSLKNPDIQKAVRELCADCQVILNTTSFSIADLKQEVSTIDLWQNLNVPVLQVIFSTNTKQAWLNSKKGLAPRDMAMNVVMPEVDGRISTRVASFKADLDFSQSLQTQVLAYEPHRSGIAFIVDLTDGWIRLRQKPNSEKKIALILANYPNQDGRIGNGVGLDTPHSCLKILQALQEAGYKLSGIPSTGEELINLLTTTKTNDRAANIVRPSRQTLSQQQYAEFWLKLPDRVQTEITKQWGDYQQIGEFSIAGQQFGNIFVGIQPARSHDPDPSCNYHNPDLVPPHEYLAFYIWLREIFQADAIVHVGKHGNLEWLPGKAVALSETCYPELILGAIPHFYPFIVNDPGEGSQAKRRTHAVILDHLTPPMTRAELYGKLQQLECLIDEYYEVETLEPDRLPLVRERLVNLIKSEHLHYDLGISIEELNQNIDRILSTADGYLCELKELQIRDGLHIFGCCPSGTQLRDLIIAIARNPTASRSGLTRAIAKSWGLNFDPLTANLGDKLATTNSYIADCRTIGDAVSKIEEHAITLVEKLLGGTNTEALQEPIRSELVWVQEYLLPRLYRTEQETTNLLRGLNGEFVPSGASGAPTRGRPEVLPTGRNFYSVDIRAIPTETAWDVGSRAAENLIEYHTQMHGEYPRSVAISIWGTATMRTGGDDFAQALALLGAQPIWDGISRRVVDFAILPTTILGRPRVDVTLRVSGFFRDAFPNLLELFDRVIKSITTLDEPEDVNPLAAKVKQEIAIWQQRGLSFYEAEKRATARIFSSAPGCFGAGLQGLITSKNWSSPADLARAYIDNSYFAYGGNMEGEALPEVFATRLGELEVVLHNQDNREHDLLDSDDYYQFQGGLANAVKQITGVMPAVYFGDNSCQQNPKIRTLQEEIARVYRARVINPKWIKGMMRHGYKGAFELAATVDFLFAYDATTNCVADFMYEGVANAYVLDEQVQKFIATVNPWALRDIAERLLEAQQRNLWQNAPIGMIDQLKMIANWAEGIIEEKM